MPWKIAHNTDLLIDHEITMDRAVPNEMPVFMVSNLYDILIPLLNRLTGPYETEQMHDARAYETIIT
jgi:hypothetical protein